MAVNGVVVNSSRRNGYTAIVNSGTEGMSTPSAF